MTCMFPAKAEQCNAPSQFSLYCTQVPFSWTQCQFFVFLCFLLMKSLKWLPKRSAEVLCLTEKICVVGKLHSGRSSMLMSPQYILGKVPLNTNIRKTRLCIDSLMTVRTRGSKTFNPVFPLEAVIQHSTVQCSWQLLGT